MKKLPKIIFAFVFLLGLTFLTSPARAQLLQRENQLILQGGVGFDDKAFNLNQFAGTIDSLDYILTGQSESHQELRLLGNRGAIGDAGTLIGKLYTPPASSIQYLAYLKQNLGLTTATYAQQQGTGFRGLMTILPVWRAFRDVAYLVFILMFVITGLLIMLRIRISPQAVATLQNALPRLLITLVLITLSYAIAGLMIDLMYVLIYLIFNIFRGITGANQAAINSFSQYLHSNVFTFWSQGINIWQSTFEPAAGIREIVWQICSGIPIITGLLGEGARGLATAIFAVAVLVALFRLFFILLKAYIWIIIMTVFAPLQILVSAFPGGSGISGWLRGLLANILVFPATVVMFCLASVFINLTQTGPGVASGWTAPLLGAGSPGAIQALLGLGFLLLTPTVAQMVNDALKPPPFPYGTAIGAAVGAGAGFYAGTARGVGGTMMSSREAILQPGQPTPQARGIGRAVAGRIFR